MTPRPRADEHEDAAHLLVGLVLVAAGVLAFAPSQQPSPVQRHYLPPAAAIDYPRAHPDAAGFFDQKYGQGASAQYLVPASQ